MYMLTWACMHVCALCVRLNITCMICVSIYNLCDYVYILSVIITDCLCFFFSSSRTCYYWKRFQFNNSCCFKQTDDARMQIFAKLAQSKYNMGTSICISATACQYNWKYDGIWSYWSQKYINSVSRQEMESQ